MNPAHAIKTQAIVYMLAAMLCLSVMNVPLRFAAEHLHSTQIIVFRHIWSILIIIAWSAWRARGIPRFSTRRLGGHFARAAFGICAMELWFYSLTIMPLNLVTALSFTTPIFSTIFAILFLKEKAGIRRWGAMMAGFVGVLIILRPDTGTIEANALFAIAASILMAGSGILVKNLTSSEAPETIVFYMSLFMLPMSVIPALFFWQAFTPAEFAIVFFVSLCSTSAQLLLAYAFQRAEMVVLMPFDFTRLIFTAILAYIFFAEKIDLATIAGASVIAASTVYMAHREAKKKRQDSALSVPAP